MKATGIVRRIDDLGRVVIPKEIRRTMRIREGDPLEIYTSRDGEVIFKKYSLLGGVEDFAADLCETMSRSTGAICAITDRDTIIAVAGGAKRELMGKRISQELEQVMETAASTSMPTAQAPFWSWRETTSSRPVWPRLFWRRATCWDWCCLWAARPPPPPATQNTSWPRPWPRF